MTAWEALKQMRQLSEQRVPFSFSFMSYNEKEQHSEGIVSVERARLRAREKKEFHKNADIVEAYLDLDTMQPRRFYQPLLMTFNGELINL